jgi:hypothetical protein
MILFCQNISKIIYFIILRYIGNYAFFNKTQFCSEIKQLKVRKIFDLYATNSALSNV